MMRREEISHDGIVTDVTENAVIVEILSKSACSACHARGLCGASEEAVKRVEVRRYPGSPTPSVGDRVVVSLSRSLGMKAVLVSYVFPLLILLILVVSLSRVCGSEWVAGLSGLAGTAVYYLMLYFLRDRIAGDYEFHINQNNRND